MLTRTLNLARNLLLKDDGSIYPRTGDFRPMVSSAVWVKRLRRENHSECYCGILWTEDCSIKSQVPRSSSVSVTLMSQDTIDLAILDQMSRVRGTYTMQG